MNSVRIREAEPKDAPALVSLARAVGREPERWLLSTTDWRAPASERRYLRAVHRSAHASVFFAEVPEGLVAR